MNGKTIGKKQHREPDRAKVEEILGAIEAIGDGTQAVDDMTARERAFQIENITLRRRADVAEARQAAMLAGADRNPMRPWGHIAERMAEFDKRVLAMGGMTPEARTEAFEQMFADVKAYTKAREEWLKEITKIDAKVRDDA